MEKPKKNNKGRKIYLKAGKLSSMKFVPVEKSIAGKPRKLKGDQADERKEN